MPTITCPVCGDPTEAGAPEHAQFAPPDYRDGPSAPRCTHQDENGVPCGKRVRKYCRGSQAKLCDEGHQF